MRSIRRHLVVTADAEGFINGGRRAALEALGRTRIVVPRELEEVSANEQAELFR